MLLMHPSTKNCTLIHTSRTNNRPPNNTLPSWLIPSSCYLLKCKCLTCLFPNIPCIKGTTPHDTHPFQPSSQLHIQFIEFTYCNDIFSPTTIEWQTRLVPRLHQLGWNSPHLIIIADICGAIHKSSIDKMKIFKHPQLLSQNSYGKPLPRCN